MSHDRPDNSLIGSSGVHFVCAELCRRGFIALPTIRNTPGVDVIAMESDTGRKVALQVKTSWNSREWLVPIEDEIDVSDDYYFVLVNLNGEKGNPDFYIFSSKFLEKYVRDSFQAWLDTPGRNDRSHDPDNKIRKFPPNQRRFKYKAFKERLGEPLGLDQFKEWDFT